MAGAKLIKLFPAQMWLPANLKSVRGVGLFGDIRYIASGGISPDNAQTWLNAGCFAVGMGSKLAGKDIGVPAGETEKLAVRSRAPCHASVLVLPRPGLPCHRALVAGGAVQAAARLWDESGRDQARGVFESLARRA